MFRIALVFVLGLSLAGCTMLYPRFDNPLNPDIALVNAGDVIDSVKCAATSFFAERTALVKVAAKTELKELLALQAAQPEAVDPTFCHPDSADEKPQWRIVIPKKADNGPGCRPDHAADPKDTQFLNSLKEKYKRKVALDIADIMDIQTLFPEACGPNPTTAYRYVRVVSLPDKKTNRRSCLPNGGCEAGTVSGGSGWCMPQDPSMFAFDPAGNAKIELNLTATNTASMNYQKIDASHWGGIFVAGDAARGFPFPTLKASSKGTNKVAITLQMSQGRVSKILSENMDGRPDDEIKAIEWGWDKAWNPVPPPQPKLQGNLLKGAVKLFSDEEKERDLAKELEEFERDAGEFSKCGSKIDFLALKDYIANFVGEQEKAVFRDGPSVSLDSLALTSEFQIVLDGSVGTQGVLRIVPVLQPPLLGFSPDHTHSLKITFAGAKGRNSATNTRSLLQRCIERLTKYADVITLCSQPQNLYNESILQALENIKTTGSN